MTDDDEVLKKKNKGYLKGGNEWVLNLDKAIQEGLFG